MRGVCFPSLPAWAARIGPTGRDVAGTAFGRLAIFTSFLCVFPSPSAFFVVVGVRIGGRALFLGALPFSARADWGTGMVRRDSIDCRDGGSRNRASLMAGSLLTE